MQLTHCGLVGLYGNTDLGQYCLRQWLVALHHQAIAWANVDLSSMGFFGTHLRPISQELLKISIGELKLVWKIHS